MQSTGSLRPLATAAGPITAVASVLVVVAVATAGPAVESSPLAIASSALLLVATLCLAAAAAAAGGVLRSEGRSAWAPALAVVGAVLVAGGQWAALFVLPGLASSAPQVLASGALTGVTVGYVASYLVSTLGWLATAVVLGRARLVPVWLSVLLGVGAVASMAPAPEAFRLLVLAVAATLLARRLTAAVAVPGTVSV